MSIEGVEIVRRVPLPKLPTHIVKCCRTWIVPYGKPGRCGICGKVPEFLRQDEESY